MIEKGNRKGKSQKRKKDQIPTAKQRMAVIKIMPDEEFKIDCQTGNVSDIEMVHFLRDLTKHFARLLINDANETVGDSTEEQEKYLDWRINQAGLNQ